MTVSSLRWILAEVQVLIQRDYGQVSVMTSLRKQIRHPRVLGRFRRHVVQDYDVPDVRIQKVVSIQVPGDASYEFDARTHARFNDVV